MPESSPNRYKTQWEKEKLFDMSNFSFSHSVFKRFVLQTPKNKACLGKGYIKTHCTLPLQDLALNICLHSRPVPSLPSSYLDTVFGRLKVGS